jgi:hypothetical protein
VIPIFYFWIAILAIEVLGLIRTVIFTIGKANISVNRILFIIPILLLVFSVTITGAEVYLFYPLLMKAQYNASIENAQFVLLILNFPATILAALLYGHWRRT